MGFFVVVVRVVVVLYHETMGDRLIAYLLLVSHGTTDLSLCWKSREIHAHLFTR